MKKRIDELSKDLASGMSTRRAFGRFLTGIGVVAGGFLTGKKTLAKGGHPDNGGNSVCVEFCQEQELDGRDFGHCMAASAQCPKGQCAWVLNGTPICFPVDE